MLQRDGVHCRYVPPESVVCQPLVAAFALRAQLAAPPPIRHRPDDRTHTLHARTRLALVWEGGGGRRQLLFYCCPCVRALPGRGRETILALLIMQ